MLFSRVWPKKLKVRTKEGEEIRNKVYNNKNKTIVNWMLFEES
jgi:hypothetical protein